MAGALYPRSRGRGTSPNPLGTNLSETEHEDWIIVTEERDASQQNPELRDKDHPWYKGRIARSLAEDKLSKSARFDGTFLVRESDALSVRSEPVYLISVMLDGSTHHVEIEKTPHGKYTLRNVVGAKEFKTLDKLVKHYRGKQLDLEGGGRIKLKYYLE